MAARHVKQAVDDVAGLQMACHHSDRRCVQYRGHHTDEQQHYTHTDKQRHLATMPICVPAYRCNTELTISSTPLTPTPALSRPHDCPQLPPIELVAAIAATCGHVAFGPRPVARSHVQRQDPRAARANDHRRSRPNQTRRQSSYPYSRQATAHRAHPVRRLLAGTSFSVDGPCRVSTT